ncbi:hypothetical protein BKA83DRAFT_3251193 [Pisolithus microcarpus]|nr:hypothetical protein BKA83DRAFT_3251193 [Pisolithus microcarpus]
MKSKLIVVIIAAIGVFSHEKSTAKLLEIRFGGGRGQLCLHCGNAHDLEHAHIVVCAICIRFRHIHCILSKATNFGAGEHQLPNARAMLRTITSKIRNAPRKARRVVTDLARSNYTRSMQTN